ncbi:aryl hydrocarbon receptor [Striga asiatica]|uniref:Aryl hydrocarbon receptor n=1 Tax=Striga asiatica TaxID=4170 RepID=A0A5A7QM44_STRAF|nr:aryl hydrocarbon receptor [Striga asiatica]
MKLYSVTITRQIVNYPVCGFQWFTHTIAVSFKATCCHRRPPHNLDVSSRDPPSGDHPSSPSSATVRASRSSALCPPNSPSMRRRRISEQTICHHGPSRVKFLTAAPSTITAEDSVCESATVRRRNLTVPCQEVRSQQPGPIRTLDVESFVHPSVQRSVMLKGRGIVGRRCEHLYNSRYRSRSFMALPQTGEDCASSSRSVGRTSFAE